MTLERIAAHPDRHRALLADPRIAAIQIRDTGEPLIDLAGRGILCADMSRAPRASRMARIGLANRLRIADRALPRGLRLEVAEGFRTAAAQHAIIDGYTDSLRRASPDLDQGELVRLSSRFVAPLDVAPHVAGAAVDVTIVDDHGHALDMGTPIDATPEQSEGACYFAADNISPEARANRSLLAGVLRSAGLVNYPTEWWHWSFGDRYWAYVTGARHARYGAVAGRSRPRPAPDRERGDVR